MSVILQVEHVYKTFLLHQLGNKKIVGCDDVSLSVEKGEFVGITGKSGSGKSSLLKCIYRTYIPTDGSIIYHSEQFGELDLKQASEQVIITLRRQEIGYVSQFLHVLPRITAIDVVVEALLETGSNPIDANHNAKLILEHFRLSKNVWDAYPNTFSGGEKLRLNLAKAMVKRPRLLLLDEPTASLDNHSKESVRDIILDLKRAGTSMVGIFHDLDFMKTVVDSKYTMNQGILEEEDTADMK